MRCFSGVAGSCSYTTQTGGPLTSSSSFTVAANGLVTSGGLLNTGTISAQALTKEDTTSNITAEAMLVGAFATIPRIDVSGEFVTGSNFTAGTISATVAGPGGGTANALQISDQANVPQIDVLQHDDLVVFGHSHIPLDETGDGVRIFNPGSPTDRRRQPHGTIGLLDIEDGRLARAEIVPVT